MKKSGFLIKFALGYMILVIVGAFLTLAIENLWLALVIALGVGSIPLVRYIRMRRYFASPEFLAHLQEISEVIQEHNDVANYVNEIRNSGRFSIGRSSTAANSNLASYENQSRYGYKRDRNTPDFSSKHIHHASLQVVRNASMEPIKYLIKYFDIAPTEEKLAEVEELGESISRLENAISNLQLREEKISASIAPPAFILRHYLKEFQAKVGLKIPALTVPYPVYKFQYVSAGGNSAQTSEVKLTGSTIDILIEELSEKIKFRKSAAGQRALMTAKLREYIKHRDSYACQICSVNIEAEPTLLLEVDHIKPLSKGGLSTADNLQTLCWKCNRSKASKYPVGDAASDE
jgi:hypothetical protein